VESSWVDESLEDAPGSGHVGYGYQWWLADVAGAPDDLFAARGHDGQYIFVIPSLDLVVVRNGTYVKDPGEPVADPNLFANYPSDGLVPGKGTVNPEHWDDAAFLTPIIESITDS
jgi:CubicO group peptidase (beta-lactamase class C family)